MREMELQLPSRFGHSHYLDSHIQKLLTLSPQLWFPRMNGASVILNNDLIPEEDEDLDVLLTADEIDDHIHFMSTYNMSDYMRQRLGKLLGKSRQGEIVLFRGDNRHPLLGVGRNKNGVFETGFFAKKRASKRRYEHLISVTSSLMHAVKFPEDQGDNTFVYIIDGNAMNAEVEVPDEFLDFDYGAVESRLTQVEPELVLGAIRVGAQSVDYLYTNPHALKPLVLD